MKKAVVFDFDYTMGDSERGIAMSINYALEKMGRETKGMDEIRRSIGLSLSETWRMLTGDDDSDSEVRFATLFKEKADEVMVDNTSLYPDTFDALAELRRAGCRTAVVTTKFHYRIKQILEKYNAFGMVDVIVGAEDVKFEKPSPEGLNWVMGWLEVEPHDTLYVGDSLVDAETARRAGVDFAAVLTGVPRCADFERSPHVFIGNSIGEIPGFALEKR